MQLLAAPLLPARADTRDWECRGFEARGGLGPNVQHAHAENFKPIRISSSSASGSEETWTAVAARSAHAVLRRKRRRLLQAICASGVVLVLEAAGGVVAHSLALMSDATHMLADISSYGIALIAVQASMDPAFTGGGASAFDCGQTEAARQRLAAKSTFGLHRVEVLGSLGSILIIWLAAGVLLYEGVSRVATTLVAGRSPPVDGSAMVVVATLGLAFNGLTLWLFHDLSHGGGGGGHGHSHGPSDATARAATLHALGDLVQSAGMILTAALIALGGEGWAVLDPVVTCLCALYMLYGTFALLQEIFLVLIEATPPEVDAHAVREALRSRPDVEAIRDFHVWALSPGKVML
jgi:zinc transporter 2